MNISSAIESRKTIKVLSNEPWPLPVEPVVTKRKVQAIVDATSYAPFHFPAPKEKLAASTLNSIVPWRIHILHAEECRKLANYIKSREISAGKILQMLHTADALLQITWLPEPAEEESSVVFEGSLRNMEHIAAASAAIQNALLTATSMGVPNYWSSGGVLRKPEFYQLSKIDQDEILLGAIFLFPEQLGDAQVAYGGLREKKGTSDQWSRTVDLTL